MSREHRVLSRLWRAFAPAPRESPAAVRGTKSVVGTKFFVMEFRFRRGHLGRHPRVECRHHSDVARRAGFAVVRSLADLHQVDYATLAAWRTSAGPERLRDPAGPRAGAAGGTRVARGDAQPFMLEVADLLEMTRPEAAALRDPAQRPQARPTASSTPPTPIGCTPSSTGTWPPSEIRWSTPSARCSNYWPDPADAPGDRGMYPGRPGQDGPADASRDLRVLRRGRPGLDLAGIRCGTRLSPAGRPRFVLQQLFTTATDAGETADERMADRADRVAELATRAPPPACARSGGDAPAAHPTRRATRRSQPP